jgi:hypothetical protein
MIVMQDVRQRVARSSFCPDANGRSKQIQIECCLRAAPAGPKGPKLEQVNVSPHAIAAQSGHLPLTAANAAGFIGP